jgi:hypothetical protein
MTGPGHSHGWAWEGIDQTTWEPGQPTAEAAPANQNEFPPHKRDLLQTEILLSSLS